MPVPIAELFVSVGADVSGAISGIGSVSDKVASAGRAMSGAGRDLTTAITGPIVGAGALIGAIGIDMENAFNRVEKTVEGTPEQLAELQQALIGLSTTEAGGGNTAAELSKIAAVGGALGIPIENMLEFTRIAAQMSVATGISSDVIGEDLARIATLTKTSSDEWNNLASTISHLGNTMGGTEAEMLELGKRLSGALTVAGASAAEILGISSAMTELGINAEAGGTAVSKFFLSMVEASAQTSGTGQVTAATAKKMQDLRDRLTDLGNQYELAKRQQQTFTNKTNPLTIERNADAIAKYEREIAQTNKELGTLAGTAGGGSSDLDNFAKVAGVTAAQFKEMVKTDPTSAFVAIINGLRRMGAEKGPEGIVQALEAIGVNDARQISAMLQLANAEGVLERGLANANQGWTENSALQEENARAMGTTENQFKLLKNELMAMALEAWPSIRQAIFTVMGAVREFIPHLQELLQRWKDLGPANQQQILAWLGLAAAAGPALIVLGAIVTALAALLTPIGLVVTLIALLAAAWINNWGDIQGKLTAVEAKMIEVQNTIRNAFINVWQGVISAVSTAFSTISGVVTTLGNLIRAVWILMLATGERVLREIAAFFDSILGDAVRSFASFMGSLFQQIFAWLFGKFQELGKAIGIPPDVLAALTAEGPQLTPTVDVGAGATGALDLARQAESAALAEASRIAAGGPGQSMFAFNAPLISGVTVTNEADEVRLAQHVAEAIAGSVARVEAPLPPGQPGVVPF